MLLQTSIISRARILSVQARKRCFGYCRRVKNGYTKYDASCTITPPATKTRRSTCTRLTATKVFDKLSRAAFAKHTSYNRRNGEPTYLFLLTRYCLFDIQRNIFHCKTHFAWYEISVYFLFFIIYTISDLLERIHSS